MKKTGYKITAIQIKLLSAFGWFATFSNKIIKKYLITDANQLYGPNVLIKHEIPKLHCSLSVFV